MRASILVILLAMLLAGCDKLTGAAEQKIADAEAVGFACRVSGKSPENCMKENEAQSPSSVLDGWKSADEDIKSGKLDPTMSNVASSKKDGEATADGEKKPDGDKPAESKKDAPAADAAKGDAKPDEAKKTEPHAAPVKEEKAAEHKDAAKH